MFLVVDIIMRLLMIEKPHRRDTLQTHSASLCAEDPASTEREPLLNTSRDSTKEIGGWHFYIHLFRQPRFTAGIVCYFVFAMFIASLESTLAIHVRQAFDWGVFPVGILFASIQGPGMVLSPFVGWLKDRVGSRVPTTIGFIAVTPFMWLLGVAGDGRFPWATLGTRGKIIYGTCTTIIGVSMCLLNGVGMMEATGKH
jgi:MFS-type transporter involved in bile tolerance (Atg22 family)